MLRFHSEHTDPQLWLHYLLYYYWNDEEAVLQSSVSVQDIIDYGYYGFLGSMKNKQLACEYYCENFFRNEAIGFIPKVAVKFFGLDTWEVIEVNIEDHDDDDECSEVDSDGDIAIKVDVE